MARRASTSAGSALTPRCCLSGALQDDIDGARALGIRAFLLDREDRHPEWEHRLPDLYALPAVLGLTPSS